ncbi:MAG: hypothetical protein VB778_05590 [Nitrospinaceae bacterium]
MKNRFDEWWKYLQEYKESLPVAANYIEASSTAHTEKVARPSPTH